MASPQHQEFSDSFHSILHSLNPERVVSLLANSLSLAPDHARFFISLLIGYPLSMVYRLFISRLKSVTVRLLYCFIIGYLLVFWMVGLDSLHSLATILGTYLILKWLKGSPAGVATVFIYVFSYLLIGYWQYSEVAQYLITWTMPQCVLTLRLIGLAFDLYDGSRQKISMEQKERALRTPPTLLELLAYCYFFGGCLAGPQFSIRRFLDMINNTLIPKELEGKVPDCIQVGISRLLIGIFHVILHVLGSIYFYSSFLLTPEFDQLHLVLKMLYIIGWNKFYLYRYSGCWLISEGACILSGLAYSGPREWDLAADRVNSLTPNTSVANANDNDNTNANLSNKPALAQSAPTPQSNAQSNKPASTSAASKTAAGRTSGRSTITDSEKPSKLHALEQQSCWEACANIYVVQFELCYSAKTVIECLNVCTNKWSAMYIYKRLRFLGSRELSQIVTLFFLAIWHGFFSGYYMSFFLEFLVVLFESESHALIDTSPTVSRLYSGIWVKAALWPIKKIAFLYILGASFVPFVFLRLDDWLRIYQSIYFTGQFYVPIIIICFTLRFIIQKTRKRSSKQKTS